MWTSAMLLLVQQLSKKAAEIAGSIALIRTASIVGPPLSG